MTPSSPSPAEAQTLLATYAWAIDDREYAAFAEVFTPDVHADYEAFQVDGLDDMVDRMTRIHQDLLATQHLVGSVLLGADGTVRSQVQATLVGRSDPGGRREVLQVGASYRDRLVATPHGWRIAERRTQTRWIQGQRALLAWGREITSS